MSQNPRSQDAATRTRRRLAFTKPALVAELLLLTTLTTWWLTNLDNPASVPAVVTYDIWPWARWPLGLLMLLAVLAWIRRRLSPRTQAALAAKRTKRATTNAGLASWWDVQRHSGWWWIHRRAAVLRPHLRSVSPWRRWRTPATQLGFHLATIGRTPAYASAEEVVGVIAPPRRGKTAQLASNIIDAPGAVVTTSTKYDIVEHTEALRTRKGPIYIFNPDGLADRDSTLRWNPVIGCEAVEIATERAGYLLAGSPTMAGVADREFWSSQAVRVLRALLHAAALRGGTMLDVLHWVSDPHGSARHVRALLAQSPAGAAWRDDYQQFVDTNENTGTSITTSIMPALQWLSNPKTAALTTCGPDEQFDVERFLAERGTLYLLGEDRPHGTIAPLYTALTAHIAATAKQLASRSLAGRLDPPFAMILDEAPLLCPVPLDRWSADHGSRGIPILWAAQSYAQLKWKWGADGAAMIWTNTTFKLVYAPGDNPDDLAMYSALAGERILPDGRREPILSLSAIRTLDPWQVLVLHGTMKPAIGKVRPVWKRHDVRRAHRTTKRKLRHAGRFSLPTLATRFVARLAARLARRLADQLAPPPAPWPTATRRRVPTPHPATRAAANPDAIHQELAALLAASPDGDR